MNSYTPMRPRQSGSSQPTAASPKPAIDILTLMDAPALFGNWFRPRNSWFAWRVLLAAAFALPIERTGNPKLAMDLFTACTARTKWPTKQAKTLTMVAGTRSGKSRIAALISTYLVCFRDYERYLAPGERGYLPVIAADRKQARVVFNYAAAFANGSELLSEVLDEEMKERLVFSHGIDLEVMTGSFKALRGYSMIGGVFDEIAYYRSDDSANPDDEIVQSVYRGTLTIPGAMLVMISSPYARRGVLWDTYKRHWGDDDSATLVWKAPTWVMNRTVTRKDLEPEFERDPEKAQADYGAEFRRDVERFVSIEALDACIDDGRIESAPSQSANYVAFVDPSGGSQDAMTLAIAHAEGEMIIIDAVYDWPAPFTPSVVVSEISSVLKNFGIGHVFGDRYGGEWPSDVFSQHGITYEPAKKPKSDLYRDVLPLMNSKRIRLPDNKKLKRQFHELERRRGRGGKDTIDHPPKGHDDSANAVAGAAAFVHEQSDIELVWGR